MFPERLMSYRREQNLRVGQNNLHAAATYVALVLQRQRVALSHLRGDLRQVCHGSTGSQEAHTFPI